ncbi:hypothetical protein [Microbacterium sp. C7(2022)]|uniref:hypothetical protein n=1 Tax=Microbacterium sp. C7(2022) TaxID=2992759 RepID=UPI00237AE6AE|nr:hypothetical protein [Microbacterium sp. C7(2022)]MDE0547142.1 hypothetical protein [Microbacterium sp. C7(2022)]
MTETPLAPRRSMGTVVAVWVVAAIGGIAIGVFVPPAWRAEWLVVSVGACLLLAFAIQLGVAQARGFIARVAMSVLGAAVVLGVISLGFGLASVVPG